MANHGQENHSSVLHVTITHLMYPVNEMVLGQVFDVYGRNEVCVLQKPNHLEAFVEFQSWREAAKARAALHARFIYDDCCLMVVKHAPPCISVHRLTKSERVVVDWGRLQVEPLASSQPPPPDKARYRKKVVALPAAPHGKSVVKPSTTLAINNDTDAINISDVAALTPTWHSTECSENDNDDTNKLALLATQGALPVPTGPLSIFMPEGATALEIPSDRPSFVTHPSSGGPPALTAVFLPPETPTGGQALEYKARRIAYAYITPAEAPCRTQPGPFIRLVFRTLALDLPQTFQVRPSSSFGADAMMHFRTPKDREAALQRQPFVLDGATVKLLRDGEIPCVRLASNDYIVHAALHCYPIEQRAEKKIEGNCSGFGNVREIDPACFEAPDLATVRVILQLEDPAEIPHELRIKYRDGSISVVPVEIIRVWHHSHSYDTDGQYVPHLPQPSRGRLMDLAPKSLLC